MTAYPGVVVSRGVDIGPVFQFCHACLDFERIHIIDTAVEWQRVEGAIQTVHTKLEMIYDRAVGAVGTDEAAIFHAHLMILEDPELITTIKEMIEIEKVNAEAAIYDSSEMFCRQLEAIDDEYIRARTADIRDVRNSILRVLLKIADQGGEGLTVPSIVISRDLTPSDCIALEKRFIMGFCTMDGGTTSHSAVLARSLGIPAVTGLPEAVLSIETGATIVLDGYKGQLITGADETTLESYRELRDAKQKILARAASEALYPAKTVDGRQVQVFANLGSGDRNSADKAIQYGAEGVGLLRSEFIYLESAVMPDEDTQHKAYRAIADAFDQCPIILRTLDIGGDKQLPYLDLPYELNPFLGVRGLRLCLRNVPLFKKQLRAALRAGHGRNLKLMFPMVTKVSEVRQARALLEECRQELIAEGVPVAERMEIGIMIEIPAAAILAHHLAAEVDFFSIGTNDLSQYTLAVDRTNTRLTDLANAVDPSVLRLIANVIDSAHAKGKIVGLCGELAGDPLAIPVLLGLGLDEFSMNPPAIPVAKQIIRKLNFQQVQLFAREVLEFETPGEVRNYIAERLPFLAELN